MRWVTSACDPTPNLRREERNVRDVPQADVTPLQKIVANLLDQFEFDVVEPAHSVEGRRFQKDMPAYCVPLDSEKLQEARAASYCSTAAL